MINVSKNHGLIIIFYIGFFLMNKFIDLTTKTSTTFMVHENSKYTHYKTICFNNVLFA